MTRTAIVVFVASLAAGAGSPQPASDAVLALEQWVAAVRQHTPGRLDAPVRTVLAMTFEDRRRLDGGFPLFLAVLTGKGGAAKSVADRRIAQIAHDLTEAPGANAFLKQAAVLHGDAAILKGSDTGAPRPPGARRPPASSQRPPSPLLSSGELLLEKDGEVIGRVDTDWNWPFARSLLDLVQPKPTSDPFVAIWYHATTAHMLATRAYGEASMHLAHAGVLLPADARVLFDRGCVSEIDGLPRSQQVLRDEDRVAQREMRLPGGRAMPNGPRLSGDARASGVRPAEVVNREAEDLFRRALDVDPTLVEARVRLARLLTLRKRYADAIRETDRALAAEPEPALAFLARMFAARAERALGHLDAAAEHVREALRLFPDAQSAQIAASQLALVRADLDGALAPIGRLSELAHADPPRPDPWWDYALGPARMVDRLLAEMWALTK